eukprot:15325549-Ditylum_brightwellii.AAC.1
MTTKEDSTKLFRLHDGKKHVVQFNQSVTLISFVDIPISSALTEEEKCIGWYSTNEIKNFKSDVREACRRIICQHHSSNLDTSQKAQHEIMKEDDDCTR